MKLKTPRFPKHLPAPDGIETFYEVRSRDSHLPPEDFARLPRHPIYIILDNLRSAFNVGAIFRLADVTRAREILLCGYTAHPPHKKLEQTALGTTNSVPWRWFQNTVDAVQELKKTGCKLLLWKRLPAPPLFIVSPTNFLLASFSATKRWVFLSKS